MNFRELQNRQQIWSERNFGVQEDGTPCLLGALEELGELSHAHLKGQQGIRHEPAEIHALKADAVADVIVYLAGYCTAENLDLQQLVEETWKQVEARDWKKSPTGPG